MSEGRKLVLTAVLSLIGGLIIAAFSSYFTYYLGKSKGAEGKKPGFDQIATQVNLDKSKWEVTYEDVAPPSSQKQPGQGKPGAVKTSPVNVATVEFNQYGSRISGEGRDNTGRKWIVEGAAAERRVCYIYFDPGDRLSFGTVLLEMDGYGTQMTGQWTGWAPESNVLQPRKVTLKKLSN